ncbi:MAG: 5'/3'-nucleotidase SurE [Caulobacterales bacterium]
MRILVTNDDGIHAEGLAVLERVARTLSDDVFTIAPETEQSGVSRALTLTAPVRVRNAGERRFAVSGTPTDCVLLGVYDLLKDKKPTLLLSGVNRGSNLADDVTLSGTIAGALAGMHLDIPSIALSQARGFRGPEYDIPWDTAERYAPGIIAALVKGGWPRNVVMNINFPDRAPDDVAEVEVTFQGERDADIRHIEKRTDLRGNGYYWIGYKSQLSNPPAGSDLRAIYDGRISVTPLHVDLTHTETVRNLKGLLGGAIPKP